MQRLGLKARRSSSSLCGISGTVLAQTTGEIDATLYCDFSDRYFPATFLVTRSITGKMPPQKLPTDDMSIIDQVHMADPNFAIPNDIDLLIGADLFDVICLTGRVQLQPRLYLRETLCGWVLSGTMESRTGASSELPLAHRSFTSMHPCLHASGSTSQQFAICAQNECTSHQLDESLKKFWEMESVTVTRQWTPEEKACDQFIEETIRRDDTGRFVVRLPFKQTPPPLGESLQQAQRRFQSLERRLQRDTALRKQYSEFMAEFQRLGHLEVVPADEIQRPAVTESFYLPHHCVTKDSSTTTKLRVVFDASAVHINRDIIERGSHDGTSLARQFVGYDGTISVLPDCSHRRHREDVSTSGSTPSRQGLPSHSVARRSQGTATGAAYD